MQRHALIEQLRVLQPKLAERGVTHVALFGSRAREDHRPDSDVDLFIEVSADKFSLLDLIGLEQDLTAEIRLPVSLTIRRDLSPKFQQAVAKETIEIF